MASREKVTADGGEWERKKGLGGEVKEVGFLRKMGVAAAAQPTSAPTHHCSLSTRHKSARKPSHSTGF